MILIFLCIYCVDIYEKEKEFLEINLSGIGYWGEVKNKNYIIKMIID